MKYEEYRGKKKGKKKNKQKNTPTADMRNPGQAEGLGEKHSRAMEEARGGGSKRWRLQFQMKLMRLQRNGSWINLQNLQRQKLSPVAIFFPQRHYYHHSFTSRKIKHLSDLFLAGLEHRFLQTSGMDVTKRLMLCVLLTGDLEKIDERDFNWTRFNIQIPDWGVWEVKLWL